VSDEEWAFCAPYLRLMKEDAPQLEHPLRELYYGLHWFVLAGRATAGPALAASGLFCNDGARFARVAEIGGATACPRR
jgi:hypothetical protein